MADGHVIIDTSLDTKNFEKNLASLKSVMSKGFSAAAKSVGVVSTAVGGLAAAAVKVGMDFDSQMSKVSAISGATGTQFDALREKAIEMGDKTKFSATESAQAFEYMAMAGWKTNDMLDGIEGIMNLAAASGEDLATTSDIVTDAMTAFGLTANGTTTIIKDGLTKEVSNATHFADVLAKASSNANTNVGMMGETFKYVAPVAGSLGYSAEDTAVAIGLMANSGIKAGQAGTALRSMLTRLAAPTKQSGEAMEQLGISLTDSHGNMKSLDELMQDLRTSFAGLTKEEKTQYASMLAGQEAMSGLLAIVNASDSDFEQLTDSIADCDGAAAEMAETMNDNLAGQITMLQSNLQTLGIRISDSVKEPLKDLVEQAQESVKGMTEAFESGGFDGLAKEIGNVAVEALNTLLGYAPQFLDAGINIIQSFLEGIVSNRTQLSNGIIQVGATLLQGIAQILPSVVESGIQIITSLIQGITDNIPQLILTARRCTVDLLYALSDHGPKMIEAGAELLGALVQGLLNEIPLLLNVGGRMLEGLANGIRESFSSFGGISGETVQTFLDGLLSSVDSFVQSGADVIFALVDGIRENLPQMIPIALEAITSLTGSLRENVGTIVDAGLAMIVALAESLIDNIPTLIEKVPTIVSNIAGCINDNAPKILETGLYLIGKLAVGLVKAIPTLISNLPKIIQAIIDAFMAFNWINLGKNIINLIRDGFVALKKALPEKLKELGKDALKKLQNIDWKGIGRAIIRFIDGGLNSLVRNIPNTLKSIGSKALKIIKNIDWKSGGKKIIETIVSGIKSLPSKISNALKSAGRSAFNAFKNLSWGSLGRSIISGIVTGITYAASGLYNSLRNLASNALSAAKRALGINSPSRVFRDRVGKSIPEGIAVGIKQASDVATDSVESLADSVMKAGEGMEIPSPEIDFDPDDPDWDIDVPDLDDIDFPELVKKVKVAFATTVSGVTTAVKSAGVTGTTVDQVRDGDDPMYVQNDIYIDGRKTAKIITPYVSKQLVWEGK